MPSPVVNARMAAAWDGDEGDDWARGWARYDRSVQGYHDLLLEAAAVAASNRVLDVGCGNGESTRAAARAAGEGAAVGVDLSSRMVERARQLAQAEGLTNIRFEQADAQVHRFPAGGHDIALSRFGAMFFDDPLAAFANIAAALRPGGRLVLVAWRGLEDNEWLRAIFAALAAGRDLPVPPSGAPGPLGLADPSRTRATLAAAGFTDLEVVPVDRPVWLGADADDAYGFISRTGLARGMTADLDDGQRGRALDALRTLMASHATRDGVQLGSGAWLVSGRRQSCEAAG